jgi:hypothetical protein
MERAEIVKLLDVGFSNKSFTKASKILFSLHPII